MSRQFAEGEKSVSPRPDSPPPMVFIIDDDISGREAVESLVRHEGLEVRSFVDAHAFLDYPHDPGASCLLLDIALPGLTGLELQKALVVERPTMPIIVITGQEDPPPIVKAMKAGAVEFFTKP